MFEKQIDSVVTFTKTGTVLRGVQYRRHDTKGQSQLSSGLWHLINGSSRVVRPYEQRKRLHVNFTE